MEIPSLEYIHTAAPPTAEQLGPVSPARLIFDGYQERIEELTGFRMRGWEEAKNDFMPTLLEATPDIPFDWVRGVINKLITPKSYQSLITDFSDYWKEYKIERNLDTFSYVVLTDHHFFSDIPIIASAVSEIRQPDPHFAQRNVMLTGRMIPGMEADINNDGNYAAVTPMLRWYSRVLQNVPGLPEDASEAEKATRSVMNEEMKAIMNALFSMPGNIPYIAGSGTRDIEDGKRLIMHSFSPQLAKALVNERLKIIRMFMSCDSFTGGIHQGEAHWKLLPPVSANTEDDVYEFANDIAKAGSSITAIRQQFPEGVLYDPNLRKIIRAKADRVTNTAHHIGGVIGSLHKDD